VQNLQPKDYPQRKIFCEHFLREADRDSRFPYCVILSDESLFTRAGVFNSHNMHLKSDENPGVTRHRSSQTWKMNVWESWELKY